MKHLQKLKMWIGSTKVSEEIKRDLKELTDSKEIEDRFYKDLEFGTGGLRGVIGAGTNRMNIYTVAKATQGYVEYLKKHFENPSIAIAYDSRNMSKEFAKATALTFAANNIKVFLFEDLRPTPELSFTVRKLNCSGGIVITASHNPKQYNGYKIYGSDGGQITDETAKEIIGYINNLHIFDDVKTMDEKESLDKGLLSYIGEDVDKEYIKNVKSLVIRKDLVKEKAKDLKIIYTPIHGSGNKPVRRVLHELGFNNVKVVKEQEKPDGNFPTAAYPNPEDKSVFKLALEMAKTENPDVIFGTDPDCDRIGVIVKDNSGDYKILTGNQTGMLLADYMLKSLKDEGRLSSKGAIIKTIVTTEGVKNIAEYYGVDLINTLTGFKYIGEKIGEFEKTKSNDFIFGLEESYGYLAGTFVRDKDAVIASTLIAEMALYYKEKGLTLYEALIELYEKFGYTQEKLISLELTGKEGQEKITKCIDSLRNDPVKEVNGVRVKTSFDYKLSKELNNINGEELEIKLPKSNVLKYILEDNSWFVIRPSGTEPKIKVYLAIEANSLEESQKKIMNFENDIMDIVNKKL
ncbi:phospho-sugar mutase [Clostridium perfringens]|uniref:phospho-sugar mutase n=1 Tax=Clostridium perfringens TaxID=1502 RepID=UPI002A335383|nr:phospho-sugar mutase [Clostridium perfringens]EHK2403258.1 phospho-sugar mutase [Clostridium perfringens]EJT6165204.1 phospho-sugar mutase [Clostridium perfringens]EJT6656671.1 phospho-sugar mutase [Clostridium perfringens]MDM0847784.1 phospho-sugar mutase [Clostridium perfringens]MDZ5021907.1 phospho-sugar mutase [Clostridium perfringens]